MFKCDGPVVHMAGDGTVCETASDSAVLGGGKASGPVRDLLTLLRTSERATCCSSEVRLYVLTPSTLRWPVRSITSCSSTPDAYNLVAFVTLNEWLVLKPWIPAALHRRPTVWASLLCPSGCLEYQHVGVGLLKGFK